MGKGCRIVMRGNFQPDIAGGLMPVGQPLDATGDMSLRLQKQELHVMEMVPVCQVALDLVSVRRGRWDGPRYPPHGRREGFMMLRSEGYCA